MWEIGTRRPRPPRPIQPKLPCSIEACEREQAAKGYCQTHYRQYLTEGETWEIGTRRGHKRFRGESDLEKKRRRAEYGRAFGYGMTVEELRAFFDRHGYKCGICGSPADLEKRGMGLVIDHDNSCCRRRSPRDPWVKGLPTQRTCGKCNRGLLCVPCNAGIGQLQEDPQLLVNAIAYLGRKAVLVEEG